MMLDVGSLDSRLPLHGLGEPLVFRRQVGSTQTLAAELAAGGAGHGTLVVADEQTEGRGRYGRHWHTPPGSAIAFSLILRPELPQGLAQGLCLTAYNLLGAVAVSEALEELGARASIKWPNDVLLGDRKVAGVLLDVGWVDQILDSLVLGIGINVNADAEPPEESVDFPSTSVEASVGYRPSREDLLVRILSRIGARSQPLDPTGILAAVNQRLAFQGRPVEVRNGSRTIQGVLAAMGPEAEIVLRIAGEGEVRIQGSDLRLRPLDLENG